MLAFALQLFASGISMGFLYSMVGIEYTMIYNSCGLLNFSHAKTIMLCAYFFVGTFVNALKLPIFVAIIATIAVSAILGVVVALVIFIPLRNYKRLIAIIATVMFGTIINEAVVLLWGNFPIAIRGFLNGITLFGDVVISNTYIYIAATAVVVIAATQFIMKRTRLGKAMTCVSQSKTAAALMGINVENNMIISIVGSFMICGIIAILTAPLFTVNQEMATMVGLKGFSAGVIGGFGSVPGCIVGGLILGILENIACIVFPSVFKDVVAFVIMIAFLIVIPKGIFGKKK